MNAGDENDEILSTVFVPGRHRSSDQPMILTRSLSHFRDALNFIPDENKKDYLEAARLAPSLVKTESHPICFLRKVNFNPWEAARSFVLYWEWRKYLFRERWLLPLNDTWGALDEEDVELLRSCWLTMALPKKTGNGRFLVCDDAVSTSASFGARLRVCFYVCCMADSVAQEFGVVGIQLMSHVEPSSMGRKLREKERTWKMIKEALPIRFKQHILLQERRNERGLLATHFLSRAAKVLGDIYNELYPIILPTESSSHVADHLEHHGVPRECTPVSHGGEWTQHQVFESKQPLGPQEDIGKLINVPWLAMAHPDEDRSKAKDVNSIYGKRAYRKRKTREQQTESDAERLISENAFLKKENARLELLHQQAMQTLTALMMTSSAPMASVARPNDNGQANLRTSM